ncbi:uncharacterized protein AKAME5_002408100, partial [Lates japonicus]
AKKSMDPASRTKVADFRCHDVKTADKYCAKNSDHAEARDIRKIIADTLAKGDQLGTLSADLQGEEPCTSRQAMIVLLQTMRRTLSPTRILETPLLRTKRRSKRTKDR